MSALRRIEPVAGHQRSERPKLNLGTRPELRWVAPTSLLVDESYQRDLGKRSMSLIKTLVANFAWRKMKPPIVVEVGGGLHCVDGQHTAIAAATLSIPEIPVFVVAGGSVQERADSFVAHNRDRIVMSPLDVYRARIAASDPVAVDTAEVCQLAGIRIRQTNQFGRIQPGDTNSVGTVQRLVSRQGKSMAQKILEAFPKAGRGPIGPAEIDAAEALMVLSRPKATTEQLANVIRVLGERGVIESKMRAASQRGVPQKHILLQMYVDLFDKQNAGRAERAA
jgi:hypothetical protein